MAGWTWISTSVQGTSHKKTGLRCQDASKCALLGGAEPIFAVIVSDGAGSADFGGEGASLTCQTIMRMAKSHFNKTSAMPDEQDVWSWIDELRDRISLAAGNRQVLPRQFASTLLAAFITNETSVIVHVGDGSIALKVGDDWIAPSWPDSGEYASTTYFVTDDPVPKMRLTVVNENVSAIAAFTDGLEKLALNFTDEIAHAPFFNGIIQPVLALTDTGRNKALSETLAHYLDSDAVNARTDDDKTLVLAVRR